MSDWDRVERVLGTDNLKRLSEVRVGVIGLGSGGGFVAQSLAMSGIQRFTLVDNDVIDAANVVRHVAGRGAVGVAKVEAVASLIADRNPDAQVETRVGLIEDHMDTLDNIDLLVVGVDHEQVKYIINEACLARKLPAVYAGVYERGEGGDVVIIRPQTADEPCYACWAAELREGLVQAQISEGGELDYGMIGQDGTLEAEPGLWLHVVRVASAQADLALNELLVGSQAHASMPGNTVIMANRHMEIIEGTITSPYGAVWVTIKRDPNCLVCGDAMRRRRLADTEAGESISLEQLMDSVEMPLEDQNQQE